jgi:hypothetical protein
LSLPDSINGPAGKIEDAAVEDAAASGPILREGMD